MKAKVNSIGFTTTKGNSKANIENNAAITFKKAVAAFNADGTPNKDTYKAIPVLHINFDVPRKNGEVLHAYNDLSVAQVRRIATRLDLPKMPGTDVFPAEAVETDVEGAQKVAAWIKKSMLQLNGLIESGALRVEYTLSEGRIGADGEIEEGYPNITGLYAMDEETAKALAKAWCSFE